MNTIGPPGAQTDEGRAVSHSYFGQLIVWAIITIFLIPIPALMGWSKVFTAAIFGVSLGAIIVIVRKNWRHLVAHRPRSITAGVTRASREQLYKDLDREGREIVNSTALPYGGDED